MALRYTKRLQKEQLDLTRHPPPSITLHQANDFKLWLVRITGTQGSLYENESYILQFKFSDNYPIESPEVIFLGPNVPIHPHIYTNGHICLSILYDAWSPAMGVASVCNSILSMLSSCTLKKRPDGNDSYVRSCSHSPKLTSWYFHDDQC
eukprot:TRINITY_DN138_c1_g2_i2.p1 TRINITY_DN138_c1_g2~~TRINITY_DN138_c1_g2_i2.p1  ORF type:complete len:150 (+),score=52.39 TRINITY_DN138_c1_g2_i2:137-586(+)